MRAEDAQQKSGDGLKWFFGILLLIATINVIFSFWAVSPQIAAPLAFVSVIFLMVAPIVAVYRGADHPWTSKKAWAMVGGGVVLQALFVALSVVVFQEGVFASLTFAISQIGLLMWCVGLGALLATLLRDKNLIIPISIFLIAFDAFLVLTPMGFTQKLMKAAPQILEKGGYTVAKASENPTMGPVGAFAYVGPADFIFMAMFFIAIYRHKMRSKETLIALIPVLVAYLVFVIYTKTPMPALVPIGLTVLIVNRKEFRMNKDEKAATIVLAILAALGLMWAATRPKPPVEPLQTEPSQAAPESNGSPVQGP